MTDLKPQYKLPEFEGPLDLLLSLIARNKLNINDIMLVDLFDQYMDYINSLKERNLDVASEFLDMASRLIYLKTLSLLPKQDQAEDLNESLKQELIEYSICKQLAERLGNMTGGFDTFIRKPSDVKLPKTYVLHHDKDILYKSFLSAIGKAGRNLPPIHSPFTKIVARKIVSVSSKIVFVIRKIFKTGNGKLNDLYMSCRSRSELIATFLAVLELCKANRIELEGQGDRAEIHLKRGHLRNEK